MLLKFFAMREHRKNLFCISIQLKIMLLFVCYGKQHSCGCFHVHPGMIMLSKLTRYPNPNAVLIIHNSDAFLHRKRNDDVLMRSSKCSA